MKALVRYWMLPEISEGKTGNGARPTEVDSGIQLFGGQWLTMPPQVGWHVGMAAVERTMPCISPRDPDDMPVPGTGCFG